MPNPYFQFKQFKIEQAKSSMKVCTDSCLFGAWVAHQIEEKIINPHTILDIGAGTGLLSLMLAQKSNATIHAVEIDKNSFEQTEENFLSSEWNTRLEAFHEDVTHFKGSSTYDLIISNPPFFENDLKSPQQNKNLAKHDSGLTYRELIQSIKNNLSPQGHFAVLLPAHRSQEFEELASANHFYLKEKLQVKQTPRHSYFRSILFFGTKKEKEILNELIIKNKEGNYTDEFNLLLKDYYL